MSTRLKLSPAVVLNADEIVEIETTSNTVLVVTDNSSSYGGDFQAALQIQAGTGKGPNLAAAINAALVAAPSGRVIKLPAGDYTVGAISYYSSF